MEKVLKRDKKLNGKMTVDALQHLYFICQIDIQIQFEVVLMYSNGAHFSGTDLDMSCAIIRHQNKY